MTMSDKAAFGSNRFPGQRPVNAAPLSSWPCHRCGRINMALARFCGKCGATREPPPRRPMEEWTTGPGPIESPAPAPVGVSQPARIFHPVAASAPAAVFSGPVPVSPEPGRPAEDGITDQEEAASATPARSPTDTTSEGLPLCRHGGRRETPVSRIAKGPSRRRTRARLPRSARALWRRLGWKVSLMAVGLFLVLPLLGMVTQGGAAGRNGAAPVCWADFQSHLSRHLGITLEEADVLARAAWGAVPQPEVSLTVDQARSVEAVLNQKEEEKIRLVPPTVVGGNLRQEHLVAGPTASAEGRFLDVSLDHPVYLAWAALLKLELPVAGPDGQARPYEPVRWDEWGRLLEALSRSAGADERTGRSFWSGRNGDLSGEDLRRSLLEVRSVLGLPIAGTDGNPGPLAERPTRLEALGALSHILSELETHASTTQQ
ncbi:MAG: zinc ribbon domain-containing protein [Candidatus Riflebacteria bacterium]|nr:zinc ribbon domain-containing protein [Candidatus Riflebacteria bacterium]